MLDDGAPIFSQIAERLADDIAAGTLAEGDRVPSTNELAAFYRINPATAAKGINVLIDDGLLEKRRGIGMFVAAGARDRLLGGPAQALRRALRRADGRRSRPAQDRHGHADLDDPRVGLRPRRYQDMTPTISVTGLTRALP